MEDLTVEFTYAELKELPGWRQEQHISRKLSEAGFSFLETHTIDYDALNGKIIYRQPITIRHLLKKQFGPTPKQTIGARKRLLLKRFN